MRAPAREDSPLSRAPVQWGWSTRGRGGQLCGGASPFASLPLGCAVAVPPFPLSLSLSLFSPCDDKRMEGDDRERARASPREPARALMRFLFRTPPAAAASGERRRVRRERAAYVERRTAEVREG